MDITKLSTKGQLVIPEKFRKGFKPGSAFAVTMVEDMIVLKPVLGLSDKEKKEIREINKIWKQIKTGNPKSYSEKEFFSAMKQW